MTDNPQQRVVEFDVDCAGARHTVACEGAALSLRDHDLQAEETLEALGSDQVTPTCLEVYRTWRAAFQDRGLQVVLGGFPARSHHGRSAIEARGEYSRLQRLAEPLMKLHALPQMDDKSRDRYYHDTVSPMLSTLALTRSTIALEAMPPQLRVALSLAVARAHPLSQLEASVIDTGSLLAQVARTLARGAAQVGVAGLWESSKLYDTRVGSRAAAGAWPVRQVAPGVFEYETATTTVACRFSTDVATATAHADDGRLVADIVLPPSWCSSLWVRGCSTGCLVLEVLDESEDGRDLSVRACRWDNGPSGAALVECMASMSSREPERWQASWPAD